MRTSIHNAIAIMILSSLLHVLGGCGNDDGYLDGYEPIQQTPTTGSPAVTRYQEPEPQHVESTPSDMEAPADPTIATFLGLQGPKPTSWTVEPPQNEMIHTNYAIPAPEGSEPAFVNIYFFGAGVGGPIEGNVQRWAGQFRTPDGAPVEPNVETFEVDGMPVTFVEVAGEYQGMGDTWHRPDHVLLAAIVDAPAGRIFIRTVGQAATIEHNREAFKNLIRGLHRMNSE